MIYKTESRLMKVLVLFHQKVPPLRQAKDSLSKKIICQVYNDSVLDLTATSLQLLTVRVF